MKDVRQSRTLVAILAVLRMSGTVLASSPAWCVKCLAAVLAFVWVVLLPVRRSVASQNLDSALTERTPLQRRWLMCRMAHHLAWAYLEFLMLPVLEPEELVSRFRWLRLENLEESLGRGRGALILTAHLGAFDLLAAATAARGFPVTIISRTPRSSWVEALWMPYRRAAGVEIVPERGSLRHVLRALRSGRIVALALDQNMNRDRGVFVRFFGRPACTLDSLAVLALRTGAPVIPVFTWRAQDGVHEAEFHPALELIRTGEMPRDIVENTQQFTSIIEREIRMRPEQWLWVHRRWKTQPAASSTRADGALEPENALTHQVGASRSPKPGGSQNT